MLYVGLMLAVLHVVKGYAEQVKKKSKHKTGNKCRLFSNQVNVQVLWEPTARVYVSQGFNVEEGTYIAKDMYKAASNFTSKHGIGLEEEHAQHIYARYAESNWQMHQAAMSKKQEDNRPKRNIFGSIISTLTGLATEEQIQAEQLREKELEKKVTKMLSHEIEAEKQLLHLGEEFNELVSAEERRLKQLQWENIQTNLYWSRKVMHVG